MKVVYEYCANSSVSSLVRLILGIISLFCSGVYANTGL